MDRRTFLLATGALTLAPAYRSLGTFTPAAGAPGKADHTMAMADVTRGSYTTWTTGSRRS